MNAPDRLDMFLLPEDASKVSYVKDTRMASAGEFTVLREDHTLANLLRMQLLRDDSVLFVGYKVPHPLIFDIHIKVQTKEHSNPIKATAAACDDLSSEFSRLREQFNLAVSHYKQSQEDNDYR